MHCRAYKLFRGCRNGEGAAAPLRARQASQTSWKLLLAQSTHCYSIHSLLKLDGVH